MRQSVHVFEEISTTEAALKILGNDIVVRSGINLAALAFEDLGTIQRLYEQATHQIQSPFCHPVTQIKHPENALNWELGILGMRPVFFYTEAIEAMTTVGTGAT